MRRMEAVPHVFPQPWKHQPEGRAGQYASRMEDTPPVPSLPPIYQWDNHYVLARDNRIPGVDRNKPQPPVPVQTQESTAQPIRRHSQRRSHSQPRVPISAPFRASRPPRHPAPPSIQTSQISAPLTSLPTFPVPARQSRPPPRRESLSQQASWPSPGSERAHPLLSEAATFYPSMPLSAALAPYVSVTRMPTSKTATMGYKRQDIGRAPTSSTEEATGMSGPELYAMYISDRAYPVQS